MTDWPLPTPPKPPGPALPPLVRPGLGLGDSKFLTEGNFKDFDLSLVYTRPVRSAKFNVVSGIYQSL